MAIFARAKGEKTACGRQGEGQVVGEMSATLVSIAKGDSAAIILDDLLDAIDYVDPFAQCDLTGLRRSNSLSPGILISLIPCD